MPRLRSRVCVPPRCFATCDSCVLATPGSERNVVVRAAPGGHWRLSEVRGVRGNVALRREAAAVLATLAGAEELHGVGNDIYRLPLVSGFLVLPLAPLEPAVDGDRSPLREVLGAVLALRAPHGDVEVVGLVDPLAGGLVLPPRVAGDAQAAHRGAAGRVAQLGVTGEIPGQDHSVDVRRCHEAAFLLSCLENRRSRLHTGSARSVAAAQERALKSGFFRGGVTWVTARDAAAGAGPDLGVLIVVVGERVRGRHPAGRLRPRAGLRPTPRRPRGWRPAPRALRPAPRALRPAPRALRPAPGALRPARRARRPAPSTRRRHRPGPRPPRERPRPHGRRPWCPAPRAPRAGAAPAGRAAAGSAGRAST